MLASFQMRRSAVVIAKDNLSDLSAMTGSEEDCGSCVILGCLPCWSWDMSNKRVVRVSSLVAKPADSVEWSLAAVDSSYSSG